MAFSSGSDAGERTRNLGGLLPVSLSMIVPHFVSLIYWSPVDDRYTVHRPVGYTPVLPATHPEMIEQPLSPPGYPMSEPPPYDAADAEHWTDAPVVRS